VSVSSASRGGGGGQVGVDGRLLPADGPTSPSSIMTSSWATASSRRSACAASDRAAEHIARLRARRPASISAPRRPRESGDGIADLLVPTDSTGRRRCLGRITGAGAFRGRGLLPRRGVRHVAIRPGRSCPAGGHLEGAPLVASAVGATRPARSHPQDHVPCRLRLRPAGGAASQCRRRLFLTVSHLSGGDNQRFLVRPPRMTSRAALLARVRDPARDDPLVLAWGGAWVRPVEGRLTRADLASATRHSCRRAWPACCR
jgi:hypothetical protein